MNFRAVVAVVLVTQMAACASPPLDPPPIVLRAHVAGVVRNATGAGVRGVDVRIACPVPDSLGQYPASTALAQSRISDSSGSYDSWIGIDILSLNRPEHPVANLTMPCAVRATRNGLAVTPTPATVTVNFAPASQTPAVVTLDVQIN